jgi:hypothetical protein
LSVRREDEQLNILAFENRLRRMDVEANCKRNSQPEKKNN